MNEVRLRALLEDVQAARIDLDGAVTALSDLPYEDLGFATLDHHRGLRQQLPEVVFCRGKEPAQVARIVSRLAASGGPVLATRADDAAYAAVSAAVPTARWVPEARAIVVPSPDPPELKSGVVIVTAGTADLPVANEARLTAEVGGSGAEMIVDVGVAGIHRLLKCRESLLRAHVVVVVAGMDGALPSVIGGLVGVPVIAVPTSVGYGASFGGLSALLTMLNSCAPTVTVVNIDNGFGAGYLAAMINRSSSVGH